MLRNSSFGLVLRIALFYVVKRNPSAAQRLSELEGKKILLDIEDLGEKYCLAVRNRKFSMISAKQGYDLAIKGRSSVFTGLIMHRLDADQLFFGRKLQIEGDIETATCLKNILAQF